MPAIVNLLFNVVSTNTTISFTTVLPMVSFVSLFVGVSGHLLLWLVLVKNHRSRSKPGSILLLHLSLADLGALLTLPCVLLSASFQNWELGDGICVLLGFIYVRDSGGGNHLTQVLCTVVVIWLVSVTMALPKVTYIDFNGGCTWSVGQDEWLFFLVPAFLVYYVAPLLCITINCGLIISHLHRCRGTLAADRRNKKATALLIGSTLVFAISWLPYYALEFVNVMSPHVSSVASPIGTVGSKLSSTLSPSRGVSENLATNVSMLWEVASLTAILLVCLAPCWNPPLYFLLSRPAVCQLQVLLPSFLNECFGKKTVRRWRIAPAPPPCLPHPQLPVCSLSHQTLTCKLTH